MNPKPTSKKPKYTSCNCGTCKQTKRYEDIIAENRSYLKLLAEVRTILLNNEEGTPIYEKHLGPTVSDPAWIPDLAMSRMGERAKYITALKKISAYSKDANGFVGPVAREALREAGEI